MDWSVIEYDNKNYDCHVFEANIQKELETLMILAGGGPYGATVYSSGAATPDNNFRLYFNQKFASIPGVQSILSRYRAKPCDKPTEKCSIFAANHAEPL